MISSTILDDTKKLLALAEATELFEPNQIEELARMLSLVF
jgi:hypothetical protein